jgi:hypothetical protein
VQPQLAGQEQAAVEGGTVSLQAAAQQRKQRKQQGQAASGKQMAAAGSVQLPVHAASCVPAARGVGQRTVGAAGLLPCSSPAHTALAAQCAPLASARR